jgi:hypothetical protein
MRGIDNNKDGKISFEEFKEWWIKGHKGKLNDLIILKSKSLKACNQLKQQFKEKGVSLKVSLLTSSGLQSYRGKRHRAHQSYVWGQ